MKYGGSGQGYKGTRGRFFQTTAFCFILFPCIIKNQDNQRKYHTKISKAHWKKLSTDPHLQVMSNHGHQWLPTINVGYQPGSSISWSARIPSDPTESHLKRTFGSFNFAQGFLLKKTSPKTHTKTSSNRYPEIKTQHCHYTPHQKSQNFDGVVIMKDISLILSTIYHKPDLLSHKVWHLALARCATCLTTPTKNFQQICCDCFDRLLDLESQGTKGTSEKMPWKPSNETTKTI